MLDSIGRSPGGIGLGLVSVPAGDCDSGWLRGACSGVVLVDVVSGTGVAMGLSGVVSGGCADCMGGSCGNSGILGMGSGAGAGAGIGVI